LQFRVGYVYTVNMNKNDNSVNIKKAPTTYHHGDLRSALLAAGLELLKDRAVDDLSLREVARTVGVSATAVYRHFPDKQALLFAMCEQGAKQLTAVQSDARKKAKAKYKGDGQKGFEAAGRAYVYFALANPALYRLMMSTKASTDHYDANGNSMGDAMQLLKDCVAEIIPAKASPLDHKVMALHAWSLVHGISMLMLDGLVAPDGEVIDALVSMPMAQLGKSSSS
jgi:AcrR family transcriptional regulator